MRLSGTNVTLPPFFSLLISAIKVEATSSVSTTYSVLLVLVPPVCYWCYQCVISVTSVLLLLFVCCKPHSSPRCSPRSMSRPPHLCPPPAQKKTGDEKAPRVASMKELNATKNPKGSRTTLSVNFGVKIEFVEHMERQKIQVFRKCRIEFRSRTTLKSEFPAVVSTHFWNFSCIM
jgi:hypothetical protein